SLARLLFREIVFDKLASTPAWHWYRCRRATSLEGLDRFWGDPKLRPAGKRGRQIQAHQLAPSEKSVDLVRADFPAPAQIADRIAAPLIPHGTFPGCPALPNRICSLTSIKERVTSSQRARTWTRTCGAWPASQRATRSARMAPWTSPPSPSRWALITLVF